MRLRLLVSVLGVFCLGGCAAALIGGAAAGGYYAGKDDRPASVIAEDAAIPTAVKSKLIVDNQVKAFDINVDTHRGVVTLKGTVRSAEQVSAAVRDAQSAKGVKSVRNELQVR